MNFNNRLKYRQHFLVEHIVEYADSLYRVIPALVVQEMPTHNNTTNLPVKTLKNKDDTLQKKSACSNSYSVTKLVGWLKNLVEEDFLSFCLVLVDCGEYCLFSALLSHHAIDCAKLQNTSQLLNKPNGRRIKSWTETMKQNSLPILDCKQPMLETERIFLQKHAETLTLLLTSVDEVLDYLQGSKMLSHEQYLLIKSSENEKKATQLVDFLTNADATSDSYQHLCHALLLTNQFTLFSILHDQSDLKRLELFFHKYHPVTHENDENQLNILRVQNNSAHFCEPEEEEMEEDVPEPSGVLEDLNVDKPDTSSASQLAYYSTTALQQDVYRNFSKPKGLALIINNYKFQQHCSFIRNRDGTEVDKKNIANLLTQLGYQVLPAMVDLTASEMLQAVFDFAADSRHAQADSCVVVVLTHGEYDYFTGVDGNKVNLHRFLSSMNSRNAPKLAGKPKIFIMQACRGETHDKGIERYVPIDRPDSLFNFRSKSESSTAVQCPSVDHSSFNFLSCIGLKSAASSMPPITVLSEPFPSINASPPSSSRQSCQTPGIRQRKPYNVKSPAEETIKESFARIVEPDPKLYKVIKEPSDADMLIAYATTPNYVSWRNSMNGTWFVQSICEVFSKHAASEDIVTMLTRVNKQVAQVYESSSSGAKQIPEMASRLRKKFYFFPGVDSE